MLDVDHGSGPDRLARNFSGSLVSVGWRDVPVNVATQIAHRRCRSRCTAAGGACDRLRPVGTPEDIAASTASTRLFDAWRTSDSDLRRALIADLAEPGSVALRARLHFLRGLSQESPAPVQAITRADWDTAIIVESRGDALVAHGSPEADACFAAVMTLKDAWPHLTQIHAEIGLGDVARLGEEVETASRHYMQARDLARTVGHLFGELRASVALGYLTMAWRNVSDALRIFEECVTLSEALDERVYLANSLLGLGEAKDRLREAHAEDDVMRAYSIFQEVRSPVGCGNAAERLASMRRAAGDLGGSAAFMREAADWQQESGDRVGACNTLDRFGDVELSRGNPKAAEEAFRQAKVLAREIPYPRGVVNADLGLAQCLMARGQWPQAMQAFGEVITEHRRLNDIASIMKSYDGLAVCAGELGGPQDDVAVRVQAVLELEALRAASRSAVAQNEYRIRFPEVYGAALRSAIRAEDTRSAVFVLECAAGRRLSGLMSRTDSGATNEFWSEAAALADQRLSGRWTPDDPEDRSQRLARMLGATAIFGTAAEQVSDRVAEVAASFFLPLSLDEAAELIDAVPAHAWCLIVAMDLHAADEVAVYARDPRGQTSLFTSPVTEQMQQWSAAAESGDSATALSFADAVLPADLRQALAVEGDIDVLVVPIAEAWRIPWPALALEDSSLLGERARLTLVPSLTMHRLLRRRLRQPADNRYVWRNPTLHNMTFDNWSAMKRLERSVDVPAALQDPRCEVVAIVSHGRGHGASAYLELDVGKPLTLTWWLDRRPPIARRIALVACNSAVQRDPMPAYEDPLTFATLALVAGADEVMATCSDLADSPQATIFLRSVLGNSGDSFATAILRSTRILLSSRQMRQDSRLHWAPLITVGVVDDKAQATAQTDPLG